MTKTEQIQTLTTCRDHWKISYQHERENVIRLRRLVYELHNGISPHKGSVCNCYDCRAVREHSDRPLSPTNRKGQKGEKP